MKRKLINYIIAAGLVALAGCKSSKGTYFERSYENDLAQKVQTESRENQEVNEVFINHYENTRYLAE